jgi:hypothetical protein
MADIRMTVYNSIYKLTPVYYWIDAKEHRQAEEFLSSIGASRTPPDDAVNKNADFYLKDMSQIHAFGRYYHRVRINRPKIGPPRLDMFFYVAEIGGHGYVTRANEDEYQEARKFLVDIGVPPDDTIAARYENPESFYFETREQYRAFLGFAKSVEERTGVAPDFSAGD